MPVRLTRRSFLGAALALPLASPAADRGVLIDTHIHLFAKDRERFPYHPNAPYQPAPQDLADYSKFVQASGLSHTIIVHPEPYQDDHRYLEYCFAHEPSPGCFKGTILLDAFAKDTPERMSKLVERNKGRIVALRVHAMNAPGEPPTTSGAITSRDLRDPRMKAMWEAARDLGLAIQMHFRPHHAPEIAELQSKVPGSTVILDHIGRAGMGTWEDFQAVLALSQDPRCYLKVSGVRYSSQQDYPYLDAKKYLQPAYQAFGADRLIAGGLGATAKDLEANLQMLDQLFDFAPESDRAKIRGLTARRLFGFDA
ncbi:MAG: amidohydrolase family protein [Acidobacteria bacterium]|nr:amidohydrolase family protein [Acidobacteriota bacterium]